MKPAPTALDILNTELSGSSLIEASAGTGKTYAITGLYLRLVLEQALRVDQILVVTFTNAATAELRDRLRQRLVDLRSALQEQYSDDDLFCALIDKTDTESGLRRVENAIRGFDEAAIFTIHGFCRRALTDSAFASGRPFASELIPDQRMILQNIVEDFWRQRLYRASPLLIHYLLAKNYSPDVLLKDIRSHLGKPYLDVLDVVSAEQFSAAEQAFAQAYQCIQQSWQQQRAEITQLLLDQTTLKANIYRKTSMSNWFSALDDYLASTKPNLELSRDFDKFTSSRLKAATKKNEHPPDHEFFNLCQHLIDHHTQLASLYESQLNNLRVDLLNYCNQELPARMRQQQIQSYDDLIIQLARALQQPERGEALAEALKRRYRAALIDEFQDTDPLQYMIFKRIYEHTHLPLFFVGDPKQAIYSFRGADIFAYLQAHTDADRSATLAVNWRSEPTLIAAVNALFSTAEQPFLFNNISFQPAQAAAKERDALHLPAFDPRPLQIWFTADEQADKALDKGKAEQQIAAATAAEIARLLNAGSQGKALLGKEALSGRDIAVLVRTHKQGTQIREQLLTLGIPSVQQGQDNVFRTMEAVHWQRLLAAIVEPGREDRIRAALTTVLLGLNGNALEQLQSDDSTWEQTLERFHHYHQLWHERGFSRCYQQVLRDYQVAARLLAYADGERRLTNVLHLAELLHNAASHQRLGMTALLKWFAEQQHTEDDPEEHQLRLESDESLVKIVTVHKSKGLEYPIVFCPFLWDGRLSSDTSTALYFHERSGPHQAVLDLGSAAQEQHRDLAREEELAENLRLLYVALTRARQRCYLVWGHFKSAGRSPLAWLLHAPRVAGPDHDLLSAVNERYQAMHANALRSELEQKIKSAAHAIRVQSLANIEPAQYQVPIPVETELRARPFNTIIKGQWQISSFTALSSSHQSVELPDYDALVTPASNPHPISARSIHEFPRGARAGSCLHHIFEHWDFTSEDHLALHEHVSQSLIDYGFSADWTDTVTAMMQRVLTVPLGPTDVEPRLCLAQIPAEHKLVELEFYYPAQQIEAATLTRMLRKYGYHQHQNPLNFERFSGFMKGFIDLVFSWQGRYYILDYKSNWLGPSGADYHADTMAGVMANESYYLQVLIYTVALHRFLRLRLTDYDYARHVGGAYYLFLRGIDPDWPGCGIFHTGPSG